MIKNGFNSGIPKIIRAGYSTRRGGAFFSKSPLNYETLSKRLNQFYKLYPPEKSTELIHEDLFINFIKANRILQKQNIDVNFKIGRNVDQRNKNANFLDISTFSNNDLESKIHEVFNSYRRQTYTKDNIVKYYLLTDPRPSDTYHLILIVEENFQRNLKHGTISKSVVQATLNLLLTERDYYNCFKLVDVTYCSQEYLQFCEKNNQKTLGTILLSCLGLTILEGFFFTSIPLFALAILNFGVPLCICWYIMKINLVRHLGRISWRPYNNFVYNNQHQNEILSINKIITHFEEHNEINIKNFHHSKVRQISNLNIFHQKDYIIELPSSSSILSVNDENFSNDDSEILKLQVFFRQEIRKRKMVLNDIQEELMFLEFWYTHGENFEWVEPDQDPAEIIRLKISNNFPKN